LDLTYIFDFPHSTFVPVGALIFSKKANHVEDKSNQQLDVTPVKIEGKIRILIFKKRTFK
jgi:hypothetical protein